MLVGCSNKPKADNAIAEEIMSQDKYFIEYDLALDSFAIEKRQTNEDQKTDYVWLTVQGSNSDFSYTADYQATYVMYNDGWLLEETNVEDYSNTAIVGVNTDSIIVDLSEEYSNVALISESCNGNKSTLYFSAEKHGPHMTTYYQIHIDEEFSPQASWKRVDSEIEIAKEELNITGEWLYSDNEGRYYYMHIFNVDGFTAEVDYVFLNTNLKDEWNYLSSNGYQTITFKYLYNEFLGVYKDTLYFTFDPGYEGSMVTGDINIVALLLEETLMTDGNRNSGFYVNKRFMERQNASETPIIGKTYIDSIDFSIFTKDSKFDDGSDVGIILKYLDKGNIDDATNYIETLEEKSDEVLAIEQQINEFVAEFGSRLGTWSKNEDGTGDTIKIRCRYDTELILCAEMGVSVTGEPQIYDFEGINNDHFYVFHSDRFDAKIYYLFAFTWENNLEYRWIGESVDMLLGITYYPCT